MNVWCQVEIVQMTWSR